MTRSDAAVDRLLSDAQSGGAMGWSAIRALGLTRDQRAREYLMHVAHDPDPNVQFGFALAAYSMTGPDVEIALVEMALRGPRRHPR
jgi:hypothetical protein